MAQKIRKIQIGTTVFEQVIEIPDAEPKRRTRKPKAVEVEICPMPSEED